MILAIESSCDESALALFDPVSGFLQQWIHSQIALHSAYGGVVPDLASREHLSNLPTLVERAIDTLKGTHVEQIAVTAGPGLAGCLALGISTAKALSLALNAPVCGVNHLRGHAWSPFIPIFTANPSRFAAQRAELLPHLGCLVSGGNTILFSLSNSGLHIIAETIDDAAGEALDKGAKLLGFPYPGGPLIEKFAANGNPSAFNFPRAFAHSDAHRFSFSGLKTSLRYTIEKLSDAQLEAQMSDLCASYQAAVVDALALQAERALGCQPFRSIGLSGGVANNTALRARFAAIAERFQIQCLLAERAHTGDNAAMIAFAAFVDPLHTRPNDANALQFDPNWPL